MPFFSANGISPYNKTSGGAAAPLPDASAYIIAAGITDPTEQAAATQFVLDLSKNVKRGLKTKAEKGWYPAQAPLGYSNDKISEKGYREIHRDPERFELVKKMWKMMLSGNIFKVEAELL